MNIVDLFQKDRSFRLIIVGVCTCIPAILSAAVSGYIVNVIGFTWAFFGFLILGVVIVLYIIFVIPETIHRDPDATIFTLQHVKKALAVSINWLLCLLVLFCTFTILAAVVQDVLGPGRIVGSYALDVAGGS